MQEEIAMTNREMDRYQVLTKVRQRELSQVDAAKILGITDRQVRNLPAALKSMGMQQDLIRTLCEWVAQSF